MQEQVRAEVDEPAAQQHGVARVQDGREERQTLATVTAQDDVADVVAAVQHQVDRRRRAAVVVEDPALGVVEQVSRRSPGRR